MPLSSACAGVTPWDGVWTALVTPFDARGEVDWPAYRALVRAQVAARVAGVVPCGTTGESPTLRGGEAAALIAEAVALCAGSGVRVLAGTGSNAPAEACARTAAAAAAGADGALLVTPDYNKPTQAGLAAHVRAVAAAAPGLPLVLYNVPGRAGVALAPATVAALRRELPAAVAAIKEASGSLDVVSDIMAACEGIMVARGDLAVEVGDASVPALQKRMIRLAREQNKLTITATQMMESMISSPIPTRAEVSDVANAVLDGTDAVMLSAETAAGSYPVETVAAMSRVCIEAEKSAPLTLDREFLDRVFTRVDQSIAMAALFTAYHLKVKAIASLTESGSTALWMSRLNCGVPIYALTVQDATRTRCALYRDTYPLPVHYRGRDREELLLEAENVLVAHGAVQEGDIIVLTIGEPIGTSGGTNTMKIVRVGEHRRS